MLQGIQAKARKVTCVLRAQIDVVRKAWSSACVQRKIEQLCCSSWSACNKNDNIFRWRTCSFGL